jgi:hypothetical protein
MGNVHPVECLPLTIEQLLKVKQNKHSRSYGLVKVVEAFQQATKVVQILLHKQLWKLIKS